MVEMDLEPRKAVNMAEEKKRKIKNVTIALKLTVCVVVALHVVEISVSVFVLNVVNIKCGHCLWTCSADIHNEHTLV
jgi:hypothetical protein